MSAKQTKARVINAFQAMKELGISEDKVKPVLKNLLKLFDKNWSLIEAENYRALIDAIFDSEEPHATRQSTTVVNSQNEDEMEEEQESEPLARPLKRLRLQHRGEQSSSLNQTSNGEVQAPLMRPKDEPGELLEVNTISQQPVSSKSLIVHEGGNPSQPSGTNRSGKNIQNGPTSTSHQMSLRNRGKGSVSPNIPSTGKRPVSGSPSDSLHLGDPRLEPDSVLSPKQKSSTTPVIKIKDETITDDARLLEAPLAVIHPDPSNVADSSSRDGAMGGEDHPEPSRQTATVPEPASPNEQRANGTLVTISDDISSNIELASSPFGEVKILLSCDIAFRRPNFQMPTLEAVQKYVEDKCLKSYKILDPNFSLKNIMKDMCQSILELGSESSTEPSKSIDVTPAIDLLNKSSARDTLGARGMCFSSFSGSGDCPSNIEVSLPVTPPTPPHCDGIDDGSQPNQNSGGDESGSDKEEQGLSLVLIQQPEVVTSDMIRSLHDVDMAKGQEKVIIVLINEVDDSLPPSFYYIPQSAIFQNANVNFSLARVGGNNCCPTCFGDCLSSATPCACATGGEFPYTADGLVKEKLLNECISMNRDPKKHCQFFCKECPIERSKSEDSVEPCKGHLVKKFIKECWLKCGCNKQCGNRVVQRGISRNLQVFMTPEGKGWGLRTLDDLPKGAFVCEYVGEVLTVAEFFVRVLQSKGDKGSYPVLLDGAWSVLKDEGALCLDATHFGNVARFINHRCYDSNLVEIPVEVETPDHHYYHVAFFTTREVKAMEELTWDYGIDFDDNDHPIKAFQCQCGSTFCRNIKHFSK